MDIPESPTSAPNLRYPGKDVRPRRYGVFRLLLFLVAAGLPLAQANAPLAAPPWVEGNPGPFSRADGADHTNKGLPEQIPVIASGK